MPLPCNVDAGPAKPTVKWSAKSGLKLTFTAPTGQTLKSAKLTLPKGVKLIRSKSGRKKLIKVAATGGKATVKYSSTSLAAVGKGDGPTKLTFTLKPGAFTAKASLLKKGKKVSLKTRVVTSTAKVSALTTKCHAQQVGRRAKRSPRR